MEWRLSILKSTVLLVVDKNPHLVPMFQCSRLKIVGVPMEIFVTFRVVGEFLGRGLAGAGALRVGVHLCAARRNQVEQIDGPMRVESSALTRRRALARVYSLSELTRVGKTERPLSGGSSFRSELSKKTI